MKISCVYSNFTPKAKDFYEVLANEHNLVSPLLSDVIVCLGGDGFMLHCLHEFANLNKPLYGINCGTIGFLLNEKQNTDIISLVKNSKEFYLKPLVANFNYSNGKTDSTIAFNEVSLLRKKNRSSHLSIKINNEKKVEKLVGDGILIATPEGSTAYNRSCGGNVLSTTSNLLALTPINPFIPLNWKGTTVKDNSLITIENIDYENRPVNMSADFKEFNDVKNIDISLSKKSYITLLFDKNNDLESKIAKQQFNQM